MAQPNPKLIQRKLKLSGLEVRKDALEAIDSILAREDDARGALDKILAGLKEKIAASGASCIVTKELVQEVAIDLSKDDEDMVEESIVVWDAFRIPQSKFNATTRKIDVEKNDNQLQDEASVKTRHLLERFNFVQQRVMRHPMFLSKSARGAFGSLEDRIVLTPIDALSAGGGDPTFVHHVLGVLTRVDEESLWLEDPTGKIALDMRHDEVTYGEGYFTVGCVVVAAGTLQSISEMEEENRILNGIKAGTLSMISRHNVLRVTALMMPPVETRDETEKNFPGISRRMLGLPDLSSKDVQSMDAMELESEFASFIILSDVHLDDSDTLQGLRKLFGGLEAHPPELFIVMGNFSRRPFGLGNRTSGSDQVSPSEYSALFENLALIMKDYPDLLTPATRWVFVPGPRDPSASPKEILPRPCLPNFVFSKFVDRLQPHKCRVTFASNPTRIMFYKQELCIFRNDTMSSMRRNCIVPSAMGVTTKDASKELITTICNQGHLCPLTLDSRPIYCSYERALRLYPLPNVLILADQYEQYTWMYKGTSVFNPGSFTADGSFVFYRPSSMEVGFSTISRSSTKDE